jgi:hypothetical protein
VQNADVLICRTCLAVKPPSEFYLAWNRSTCKTCVIERAKARFHRLATDADLMRDRNITQLQFRGTHVWDLSAPRAVRARARWLRQQRAAQQRWIPHDVSSHEAIERLLFARLTRHVRTQRRRNRRTTFTLRMANFAELLDYTLADLRQHMTACLPAGLTWDDVADGALHIDHKTPSAAFDLHSLSGFRACYSRDNLQWLTPTENAMKSLDDRETVRLFGHGAFRE